eukprot:8526324-Pyramimonas_sp.AAC.1
MSVNLRRGFVANPLRRDVHRRRCRSQTIWALRLVRVILCVCTDCPARRLRVRAWPASCATDSKCVTLAMGCNPWMASPWLRPRGCALINAPVKAPLRHWSSSKNSWASDGS